MPYKSVNPAAGEVVKTFANHADSEVQAALSLAHALYRSEWSTGPIEPRLSEFGIKELVNQKLVVVAPG